MLKVTHRLQRKHRCRLPTDHFTRAQTGNRQRTGPPYRKVDRLSFCVIYGSHRLPKLHVLCSHFARLNTVHELDQARILYFQCVLDQRSNWSWYWTVGCE